MTYTVNTPTGASVTAKWVNNHFEIICHPDALSVLVEWCATLDYAAHRFQWLVDKYQGSKE